MYDLFLFDTLPRQQATMASYILDGQQVWLKRQAKRNSRLAYLPLKLLAKWLKVEALQPVPNLGGKQSIITESRRLKALSQSGVRVPVILAESPNGLLLADAGTPDKAAATLLEMLTEAGDPKQIDHYLHITFQALNSLHRRDCYLSEAFARNILIAQEEPVFIDFETDPREYHSLTNCMVRDWHCLIFSLYGKLYRHPMPLERLTPAIVEGLKEAQGHVRESFLLTLPKLQRLKRLPFKRFGSDGRKIAYTLNALTLLEHQLRIK
jgi:tRNA A-37 threonylcarbamoyl transferase component Bud32